MKLLHTADLHLGATWGNHSRAEDQARVLGEILELCDRLDVDMLLVAGDVFADRAQGSVEAKRLLDRLAPHLRRGRAVVLLRGNHDSLPLFTLLRTLVTEMGGERWPLVVADLPDVYPVPGHALQVIAFPYIGRSWLIENSGASDVSPEARTAGAAGQLPLLLDQIYACVSPEVPAIFTGHSELRGAKLTPDREVESGYRELWLEPAWLPAFTSYNALGHIHLAQEVRGVGKPTWYAGAPDRMNLGERRYAPRVLLVTTPETPGRVATVESIPLATCTPWVMEEFSGETAVEEFCAVRRCRLAM